MKSRIRKKEVRNMGVKSLVAFGVAVILGVAGYLALHGAHSSPAVAEKQAEGPVGLPEITAISGLARSRDGHILATVDDNKTVALWDAASGTNLRALESSQTEWIYAPAFSPDGSLLATPSSTPYTSSGGHLLLWDPATGQRLTSVDDLSWPVCCASFNSEGTLIAVAGNTTLYLVDPSTKQIIRQAEMEHVVNGVIQAVEFNPKGDLLATAKRNGKVELWQVPDLKLIRAFSVGPSLRPAPVSPEDAPAAPQAVSVTFAHNFARLAANNSEGSVFVWDLNTGQEIVRYGYNYSDTRGNSSVYAPLANSLSFTSDDLWLLTMDQETKGMRLLGADRKNATANLLTMPKDRELGALNISSSDGSVAYAYHVFHPGEPGPPQARFEIWSLKLR
jgi:WD40 repeat protein